MSKLYPFSVQKHAHDIEFRRNRVKNEMYDMESGETEWNSEVYDKMEALEEALTELLLVVMDSRDGRVAWLTGKQIALTKETVAWARESRANSLIKAGKTQYIKYC